MLPKTFILFTYRIDTLILFIIAGFLVAFFLYWFESRRDGFHEDTATDLFLLSSLSALLLSRIFFAISNSYSLSSLVVHTIKFWVPGYSLIGAFIGLFIPYFSFSSYLKWSRYRLNDIVALCLCIWFGFILLGWGLITRSGAFLFGSAFYLILTVVLLRLRLSYKSGWVFTLFLLFTVLFGLTFFRATTYLIFYAVLITISIVNIYSRYKDFMPNNLPQAFIDKVKKILTKKDKDLKAQQQHLIGDDPYLIPGRSDDNELSTDVREDVEKTNIDLRLNSINDLRNRVKKALAKINIGTYGYCEVCKKPIEKERLEAFPESTTCIEHAK